MPVDPISSIGGLGLGLIGGVASLFGARRANKRLDQLLKEDPSYAANPLAAGRLALSRNLLNARMPGASSVEQNIYGNEGNQLGNISRYATDSSTAISAGAAAIGAGNRQFQQLGQEENQDYQRRFTNYVGAEEGQIGEDTKVF